MAKNLGMAKKFGYGEKIWVWRKNLGMAKNPSVPKMPFLAPA
jgi:hypothetical protein